MAKQINKTELNCGQGVSRKLTITEVSATDTESLRKLISFILYNQSAITGDCARAFLNTHRSSIAKMLQEIIQEKE